MRILDVISYQGSNDVLVYRSPKTDFTNYSRLIVHESQVAYVYLDGKMTGPYGPGDYTMDTGNIPILEKIVKIPYGGEAPFKAEVYFVNGAAALNRPWGTRSRARVQDQTYGMMLDIGANGIMGLRIRNPYQVMQKIVGTESQLTVDQCLDYFRENIGMKVKEFIAQVMARPDMNFMLFDQRLSEFSAELKQRICGCFEDVGVEIYDFVLAAVDIPEEQFACIRYQFNTIAETRANTHIQVTRIQTEGEIARKQAEQAIEAEKRRVDTETARIQADSAVSEQEDALRAEQEKRERARAAAEREGSRQEDLKDAQLDSQKDILKAQTDQQKTLLGAQGDIELEKLKQQLSYLHGQTDLLDAQQGVELEKLIQERERLKAEAAAQNARVQNELDAQRTKMQGEAEGAARAAQGYTWQDQQNAEVSKISAEHPPFQQPFSQFFGGQTYVNPQPFQSAAGVNKQAPMGPNFDAGMGFDFSATAGAAGYAGDIGPAQDTEVEKNTSGKRSRKERLEELKELRELDLLGEEEYKAKVAEILKEI